MEWNKNSIEYNWILQVSPYRGFIRSYSCALLRFTDNLMKDFISTFGIDVKIKTIQVDNKHF